MQTLKRLLLTVSMGCFMATANADPLDDADAAYKRGDYAQALKIWRPLAAEGNSFSQIALGFMYVHGLGVMRNYQEAVKWYRVAAAQRESGADAFWRDFPSAQRGFLKSSCRSMPRYCPAKRCAILEHYGAIHAIIESAKQSI